MSGSSCHPEECIPRLVIVLLSANCFLDGRMDENVQPYRFSGWRFCQTSVHLSPPDTSASRCECCEQEGTGWGGEKRSGLIHTIVIRSVRRMWREPKLRGYVSIPTRLLFVILAWVWTSPCHLSPSSQAAARANHRGGCRGSRERNTLPWEQVIMRMRLGRINQLAQPTQAY